MRLLVEGRGRKGLVHGFAALWLKYPEAWNAERHCIDTLVGAKSKRVHKEMPLGAFELDESGAAPFVYLCGVTWEYALAWSRGGSREDYWKDNLHLAVRPRASARAEAVAYNGLRFVIEGAEAVDIPPAPDGTLGKPRSFTTCRNWLFGLAHLRGLQPLQPTLF